MDVAVDKEGFLRQLEDWSPEVAAQLAQAEGISLTPAHWEILELVRQYYLDYAISPPMRVLVKLVNEKLGPEKGRSVYLLTLYPDSPAKLVSKLAGLPKPTNCD